MATTIASGTITNAAGITLSGGAYGVEIAGSPAGLTNYGSIAGTIGAGVILLAGGSVTNSAGGTITGSTYGVHITGSIGNPSGAGTVTNSGLIAGGSNSGVDLYDGGTVTNSGVITGSAGVRGRYGFSTVDNSGTITGTGGTAVQLNTFQHNRVIDRAGAVFNGIVNGGNNGNYVAYSTLELAAGGAGTLAGIGTQFIGLGRINVDSGASWTLAGTNTLSAGYILTNAGTLTDAGTLTNAGTILGPVALTPGAVLSNAATGTINSPAGIAIAGQSGGAATVVNAGYIDPLYGTAAISLKGGGLFTNLAGGRVAGYVHIYGNASVTNAGLVTGSVFTTGGSSSITNATAGTIQSGVDLFSAGATFANDGSVSNASFNTVVLVQGGTVTNGIHGVISLTGTQVGKGLANSAAIGLFQGGTVVNAGLIASNGHDGVAGPLASVLTNLSGGTIAGAKHGVYFFYFYGGAATVTNAGTIAGGTDSVLFGAGAANRLIVDPGAVFSGIADGGNTIGSAVASTLELATGSAGTLSGWDARYIDFGLLNIDSGAAWTLASATILVPGVTLTNAGTLTGPGYLTFSGILSNSGVIASSGATGIAARPDQASTIVNAGTIAGGTDAVLFAAGFANRLILDPGAAFSGIVDGGNTIGSTVISTLEFGSSASAGTLSGIGSQYAGFGQIAIDTAASWTLAGSNSLAAGYTLTNAGTLTLLNATLTGGGGIVNNGGIVIDPSSVAISSLTGTGTTTIAAGSTLDVTGTISAGETIVFIANPGTLAFDPTQFAGEIDGFQAGDTIDLTGVTDATSATIVNSDTLQILRSGHPAIDLTLGANSNLVTASFAITAAGVLTTTAPCFCPGTLIRTDRGDVAVEALTIGDTVVTASGAKRPIKWIGYRHMDLTRHPAPHRAQPICVCAGAFGHRQPSRNLFLSPEHAVLRDGLLIPIRLLVNDASIVRETRASVTYYHIELETHDILLAEDLPVESYLDTGNRGMFSNAGCPLQLHPDLTNDMDRRFGESCAPFADDPGRVRPIWQAIARRAEQIGMPPPASPPTTDDPDLHLMVDGRRIDPVTPGGRHYLFMIPGGADRVRLVSRSGFPSDTAPWISDERRLGVQLCALTVRSGGDARQVALDDPGLGEGWWAPEWHARTTLRRWTNGDAVLTLPVPDNAADVALLDIEVGAPMDYRLTARGAEALTAVGATAGTPPNQIANDAERSRPRIRHGGDAPPAAFNPATMDSQDTLPPNGAHPKSRNNPRLVPLVIDFAVNL